MTPEITVTPSNYRWLITSGAVSAAGLPPSAFPAIPNGRNCARCRRNAYQQAEYPRLYRMFRSLDPSRRDAVLQRAKESFRLKTTPSIRMTMGGESYLV